MTYKDQIFKTKAIENAGNQFEWKENFDVKVENATDTIEFRLYNKSQVSSDCIGVCSTTVSKVLPRDDGMGQVHYL